MKLPWLFLLNREVVQNPVIRSGVWDFSLPYPKVPALLSDYSPLLIRYRIQDGIPKTGIQIDSI
jgi:hypothetical protein